MRHSKARLLRGHVEDEDGDEDEEEGRWRGGRRPPRSGLGIDQRFDRMAFTGMMIQRTKKRGPANDRKLLQPGTHRAQGLGRGTPSSRRRSPEADDGGRRRGTTSEDSGVLADAPPAPRGHLGGSLCCFQHVIILMFFSSLLYFGFVLFSYPWMFFLLPANTTWFSNSHRRPSCCCPWTGRSVTRSPPPPHREMSRLAAIQGDVSPFTTAAVLPAVARGRAINQPRLPHYGPEAISTPAP